MEEIARIKEQLDKTLEYVAKLDVEISMETWEKLDIFYRKVERIENLFQRIDRVNDWLDRYGNLFKLDTMKKVIEGVKLLEPIIKVVYEEEDD